jgi:hypothetical protein
MAKLWKGIACCKRCYYAKTDKKKCRCRCHGINHQQGLQRAVTQEPVDGKLERLVQTKLVEAAQEAEPCQTT